MKKSIFIAALVLVGGLFLARPSSAQLHAGGQVITDGTWNVMATQLTSTTWQVTVNWGGSSIPSDVFVDQASFKFGYGGTITTGVVGGVTEDSYGGAPGTFGYEGVSSASGTVNSVNWINTTSGSVGQLDDPGIETGPFFAPDTNVITQTQGLTGIVTLSGVLPPGKTLNAVEFTLDNSVDGNGWFAITPEGSSMALLLPGLIPLGLILRRRRKV